MRNGSAWRGKRRRKDHARGHGGGGTWAEAERVGGDIDTGASMHEHMEMGGTIVEEEDGDPTTFSTSQFTWSCCRPTT